MEQSNKDRHKLLPRWILTPACLLIWIGFMGYLSYGDYKSGALSGVLYFSVLGISLVIVIVIALLLRKKEKYARRRKNDMNL